MPVKKTRFGGYGREKQIELTQDPAAHEFRYCFTYLAKQKAAGAKAFDSSRYGRHD
jgi:hypothetical protein